MRTESLSPVYSRIDLEIPGEELLEKDNICHTSTSKQSQYYYLLLSVTFIALAGMAGFLLGSLKHHAECERVHLTDTVSSGKTFT